MKSIHKILETKLNKFTTKIKLIKILYQIKNILNKHSYLSLNLEPGNIKILFISNLIINKNIIFKNINRILSLCFNMILKKSIIIIINYYNTTMPYFPSKINPFSFKIKLKPLNKLNSPTIFQILKLEIMYNISLIRIIFYSMILNFIMTKFNKNPNSQLITNINLCILSIVNHQLERDNMIKKG